MTVKQLIDFLKTCEPNAIVDMSIDEEGNGYGDISFDVAQGKLKDGRTVYTLYPENQEMPEQRYK